MKTRKIVVEVICFVLLMFWFYEGVYKMAYWGKFSLYIKYSPLLKPFWQLLAYSIPIGEIGLASMFLFPKRRIPALYISIGSLIVFVFWIMSVYFFAHRPFWPYHALWKEPTWIQKMLISLFLAWGALAAIVLSVSESKGMNIKSNVLRNKPVNAS